MKYDVFISYSRKDTPIADQICEAFEDVGISYFIDRQGIGGAFEFPEVLAKAIVDSQVFLYLASKNSYTSKFTNSEITFAFNKKGKNKLLPYIIDGSEMPIAQEFIFSAINRRNIQEHPISSTLVNDILTLLGRDVVNNSIASTSDGKYTFEKDTNQLVSISENGKYGLADSNGRVIVPCVYDNILPFFQDLARVSQNRRYGYINRRGQVVIPIKFGEAYSFSHGLAAVSLQPEGLMGFINQNGQKVIDFKYPLVGDFSDGLATVWNGSPGHPNSRCGFIDTKGRLAISFQYERANGFRQGLAAVMQNGKWGFIDTNGNIIVPFVFKRARSFYEGLAPESDLSGKYKFIDREGNTVIPAIYDDAAVFKQGKAWVKLGQRQFYIDHNGNPVS